jgi:hypothetical protein
VVAVDWHKVGLYRRIVRKIIHDNTDVNLSTVRADYAW